MRQYLDLLRQVFENGEMKESRAVLRDGTKGAGKNKVVNLCVGTPGIEAMTREEVDDFILARALRAYPSRR